MQRPQMGEAELREAFHAAFDGARPRPDAPDRAFEAVAAAGSRDGMVGRRLAGAVAIALAVLLIAVLQLQRGGLLVPRPTAAPVQTAVKPVGQQPATPPRPTPAPGPAVNRAYPEMVAADSPQVALAGWGRTGQVALTVDGGATWTTMRPAAASGTSILDLQWVDDDRAFVSTSAGLYTFQRSTGGWTRVTSRPDLVRIDMRGPDNGFMLTAAGDVLQTVDGGQTLTARDVGIRPVTWIQWVSAAKVWAAGPQGVVASGDGGGTWARQLSFPTDARNGAIGLAQVGFRDEANGFALFDVAGSQAYAVYHTADGGATWKASSCSCGRTTVPDWLARDARPGLPAVPHGALLVTGASQAMLVSNDAAGATTSICATDDAGDTWACRPVPFVVSSGALVARGRTLMLAADTASGPVLSVSADGGATWTTRAA